jgi:hypothetical protein
VLPVLPVCWTGIAVGYRTSCLRMTHVRFRTIPLIGLLHIALYSILPLGTNSYVA